MTAKTLEDTFSYFIKKNKGGINKACKEIVSLLGGEYVWKYIYHIYRGTSNPSDKLKAEILKLRTPKIRLRPPRKRNRMIIEATNKKQFKAWQILTMDEKRNALDKEAKRKHGKQTKNQSKTMQK